MTTSTSVGAGRSPVALVTGGRRGIGRGCAYSLAEAGYDIVIDDLEKCVDAEETLAGIESRGRRAAFVQADISDLDQHERLLDETLAAFGFLDCLVNNAGVSVLNRGDMLEMTVESYDRCLNTNLRGSFFLTQRVAKWMVAHPAAESDPPRAIVSVSSVNAEIMAIERAEYCLSKTGLAMMTKLFGIRLAEEGIGVYEVRPGIIHTPMTAGVSEKYDRLIEGGISPVRRWGEPEDVGKAVATLAAGGIPFSIGQHVNVDGGLVWRHF
ncbi:MAG: 3-ketoacyl-ACP reductase [Rhodospirillales bacterium]|nr:3-ketoacyl-ACP reductase [Rhodospirillales bacterium]